MINYLIFML